MSDFINELLNRLQKEKPEAISSFQDPDLQCVLFDAQKAYARSGENRLKNLLVNILVKRAGETDRSFKQIVLNEAINTAPKLTEEQLNTISLVFLLKYKIMNHIFNLDDLIDFFNNIVLPLSINIIRKEIDFKHLEYIGCTNNNMYQFVVDDYDSLELICSKLGIRKALLTKLWKFLESNTIGRYDIENTLSKFCPGFKKLIQKWDLKPLSKLLLTTVGIVIAQANIHTKDISNYELSEWIY